MSITKNDQAAGRRNFASAAATLALFALASCAGGSGGGTVTSTGSAPPTAEALVGDWNFYRTAAAGPCNDFEFDGQPMRIDHISGNDVRVLVGDPGQAFEFFGAYDPASKRLSVSGISTMDGTTIDILSASWQMDAALNECSGHLNVSLTQSGASSCTIYNSVDAYRQDSTENHPLVDSGGDEPAFIMLLEVLESDNPDNLGGLAWAIAQFFPQRDGYLTLVWFDASGDVIEAFQDVSLVGSNVHFPSTNVEGDVQILSTDLYYESQLGYIEGTLETFDGEDGHELIGLDFWPYNNG